jgi:hypothetical protein
MRDNFIAVRFHRSYLLPQETLVFLDIVRFYVKASISDKPIEFMVDSTRI